jgi:hypothetical protein
MIDVAVECQVIRARFRPLSIGPLWCQSSPTRPVPAVATTEKLPATFVWTIPSLLTMLVDPSLSGIYLSVTELMRNFEVRATRTPTTKRRDLASEAKTGRKPASHQQMANDQQPHIIFAGRMPYCVVYSTPLVPDCSPCYPCKDLSSIKRQD